MNGLFLKGETQDLKWTLSAALPTHSLWNLLEMLHHQPRQRQPERISPDGERVLGTVFCIHSIHVHFCIIVKCLVA